MDKPTPPLTKRNALGFFGFNLTFGGLLSWLANLIQVLTVKNGLFILLGLASISICIYVALYILYLCKLVKFVEVSRDQLETAFTSQLQQAKNLSEELQNRLDKLVIEFRSRSSQNTRPIVLNALMCTKRIELSDEPLSIGIKDVTKKLIVIDKGEAHGLSYGMAFALHKSGQKNCVEVCGVDRIESHSAWLSHSGSTLSRTTDPSDIDLRLVYPQGILESERELAEMLLMAEGYSSVRMI